MSFMPMRELIEGFGHGLLNVAKNRTSDIGFDLAQSLITHT